MAPRAAPCSGCPGHPALPYPCHPDSCCEPPTGLVGGCLPWSPCPALPCPCPAMFVTIDRQTDTTVAFIYKILNMPNDFRWKCLRFSTNQIIWTKFHAFIYFDEYKPPIIRFILFIWPCCSPFSLLKFLTPCM
jgi:hypothetical protein